MSPITVGEKLMSYWVYEDDPTNRVRIHKSECTYCNDGEGIKGSRLTDNRWHGPFQTEQEAIDRARRTGRRDAKGCGVCLPGVRSLR